jgi:hypothetical protein
MLRFVSSFFLSLISMLMATLTIANVLAFAPSGAASTAVFMARIACSMSDSLMVFGASGTCAFTGARGVGDFGGFDDAAGSFAALFRVVDPVVLAIPDGWCNFDEMINLRRGFCS